MNLNWLKELFAQPHLQHIKLVESFAPKWFAFKRGEAMYNPKQIEIAHPLEFKYHVLDVLFANKGKLTLGSPSGMAASLQDDTM